jgi:dGTPase
MKGRATQPYASRPELTRGRLIDESPSPSRNDFQRDRDRIIHSTAFRRLAHKTQVFVHHEGDHYRTRLTHSLEVSQIARAITRTLGGDDDLAEALALAHDLGHTPFGHTGEEALDAAMASHGGFDHNAQSVRVVTRLERRYAAFDGLNLTWETLEGLIKHNGPLTGPHARGDDGAGMAHAIAVVTAERDFELGRFASLEAQIASISDDIAYNNHDIDDGIRAELFQLSDLGGIDLVRDLIGIVLRLEGATDQTRQVHEMMRRLMSTMVDDVVGETSRRLAALGATSPDGIRSAGGAVVDFSAAVRPQITALRSFLFAHMYFHDRVRPVREIAAMIVERLFALFMDRPDLMPDEWQAGLAPGDGDARARRVADFIAGMTDRFAIRQYETRFAPIKDFG